MYYSYNNFRDIVLPTFADAATEGRITRHLPMVTKLIKVKDSSNEQPRPAWCTGNLINGKAAFVPKRCLFLQRCQNRDIRKEHGNEFWPGPLYPRATGNPAAPGGSVGKEGRWMQRPRLDSGLKSPEKGQASTPIYLVSTAQLARICNEETRPDPVKNPREREATHSSILQIRIYGLCSPGHKSWHTEQPLSYFLIKAKVVKITQSSNFSQLHRSKFNRFSHLAFFRARVPSARHFSPVVLPPMIEPELLSGKGCLPLSHHYTQNLGYSTQISNYLFKVFLQINILIFTYFHNSDGFWYYSRKNLLKASWERKLRHYISLIFTTFFSTLAVFWWVFTTTCPQTLFNSTIDVHIISSATLWGYIFSWLI